MTTQHIYARLSPNPEGQQHEEMKVDDQIVELTNYVTTDRGRELGQVFRDDGISATRRDVVRPGFESLLATVKKGERVAVWDIDRFIRTSRDLDRVIDAGIMVDAKMTGHIDLSTPAGIAVAKTVVAWAQFEGEHKADRQRFAHRNRANRGIPFHGGSSRPFGYHKAIVDGVRTYLVDEEEAKWVRYAYDAYLKGNTLGYIAIQFNENGIKTAYDKKRKGEPPTREWTYGSISDLLRQSRNAAILTYKDVEVGPGNWPALVPEETYRAAMRKLTEPTAFVQGPRKGKNGVAHWLTGVVICGVCNGRTGVLRRHGILMYRCVKGCASVRKDWVEGYAQRQIVTRLTSPIIEAQQNNNADLTVLHAELDRMRLKSSELAHAFATDLLTMSQFGEANKIVQGKIKVLERDVAAAGLEGVVADLLDVDDMESHWPTLTERERNSIAKGYFEKIVMRPRGQAEKSSHGHAEFVPRAGAPLVVNDIHRVFDEREEPRAS